MNINKIGVLYIKNILFSIKMFSIDFIMFIKQTCTGKNIFFKKIIVKELIGFSKTTGFLFIKKPWLILIKNSLRE